MHNQASLPPIVKTLVNLKLVDEESLRLVLSEDDKTSETVILKAVSSNLVTGSELAQTLSAQFGSPCISLKSFDIEQIPLDLIDIALADQHLLLPLYQRGSTLYTAITDPTNPIGIEKLQFNTGLNISTLQCNPLELRKLITLIRSKKLGSLDDFVIDGSSELIFDDESEEDDAIDQDNSNDSSPIIKYVNKVLIDAINKGASDIHIEAQEKSIRIRFRIDGVLHHIASQPRSLAAQIIARIKIIGRMDISERRVPQDGRVKVKLSGNTAIDFRISTLPTVHGEKAVLRILDSTAANLDLESLGFDERQLKNYLHAVSRPYGMVLITGPTGSGKTVTLYSAISMLNDPSKNISTVEDPVEIFLDGITQVAINERAGLTFAMALRSFLRQDPDILMLGEIRDLETAEIAIKAAQTGHMVLSTLHTNDAPSTLTRLLNMGVPAFNIASAVQLIVAQRLVRKLCSNCKQLATDIPHAALEAAGFSASEANNVKLFKAQGCDNCTSGYRGRTGIFQVMPISDTIKSLIMQGCTEQDIEEAAFKEGGIGLRQSGLAKVKQGVTSLEEIERVTNA